MLDLVKKIQYEITDKHFAGGKSQKNILSLEKHWIKSHEVYALLKCQISVMYKSYSLKLNIACCCFLKYVTTLLTLLKQFWTQFQHLIFLILPLLSLSECDSNEIQFSCQSHISLTLTLFLLVKVFREVTKKSIRSHFTKVRMILVQKATAFYGFCRSKNTLNNLRKYRTTVTTYLKMFDIYPKLMSVWPCAVYAWEEKASLFQ